MEIDLNYWGQLLVAFIYLIWTQRELYLRDKEIKHLKDYKPTVRKHHFDKIKKDYATKQDSKHQSEVALLKNKIKKISKKNSNKRKK